MLFEAFLIFYLLEILVLTSVAVWFYYEPKKKEKKFMTLGESGKE